MVDFRNILRIIRLFSEIILRIIGIMYEFYLAFYCLMCYNGVVTEVKSCCSKGKFTIN